MDLDELKSFVAVAERSSFSAGARAISVPTSTVSRHVQRLEVHLGISLFQRSTRHVRLTDAGQRVFERARFLIEDLLSLESELRSEGKELRGRVRLALPPELGPRLFSRPLAELSAEHPLLELHCSIKNVSLQVSREELDLAVLLARGPLTDSAWIVKRVASLRSVVVASPAFLRCNSSIARLKDLLLVPCISTAEVMGGGAWYFEGPKTRAQRIDVRASYRVDSAQMALYAARAGVGVALLPWIVCGTDVNDGSLCELHLDSCPTPLDVYLARPQREYVPRRVSHLAGLLERTLSDLD